MEMRGKGVVFNASWRSGFGWLTLLGALVLAVLLFFGIARGVRAAPLWGGVAVLALVVVPAFRRLAARVPVLSLGPGGLRSVSLPGCTVGWDEIEEIDTAALRSAGLLVLRLRPDADALRSTRSWRQRGNQRVVSLRMVAGKELQVAADATIAAFEQFGARDAVDALRQRTQALADLQGRLQARVPVVWALYLVVALNVGVWLAGVAAGVDPMSPSSDVLYAWGANSAWAVQHEGQWWRLITATVLHGGVLHLGLNMLALWGAGTLLCRWYGNGRFLLLYGGAALLGSALSLHFSARLNVSVGASGAVFGVLGGMLVAVWRQRGVLPEGFARKQLGTDGVWIVVMLAQGFARPGIDNAAHVGGLVAGVAMAFLLPMLGWGADAAPASRATPAAAARRAPPPWAAAMLVAAAVGLLVSWPVAGSIDHGRLFREQPLLQQAGRQLQEAVRAFEADARAAQQTPRSPAAEQRFVEAIRTRHAPAFRRISALLADPALDPPSEMLADTRRLVTLYGALLAMILDPSDPPDARERLARIQGEMQAVATRMAARAPAAQRRP